MDNFDPTKHVNYAHLVGVVKKIVYKLKDVSPHATIDLKIQTDYKGNVHQPMTVPVVAWDRTAYLMKDNNIKDGDLIHIEGRLTFREKDGKSYFGVTANRVKVVLYLEDKEPFAQKLEAV